MLLSALNERWSLAAGHLPDALALGLLALVVAVAVAEAGIAFARRRPGVPRRRALAILGLRALAIASLLAIALELTLRVDQVAPTGRRLVVLVDRSASMALADATEDAPEPVTRQSRLEALWRASADARARWHDEGYVLDIRGFEATTRTLAGDAAETLGGTPTGAASDLSRALAELREPPAAGTPPMVGVVVLSDGLVAPDNAADQHVRRVAASLEVPLTTAALGAPTIRDASVAEVRGAEFAFVENVTSIEAGIVAHGLRGRSTRVELIRNGEVVATQPLRLLADGIPQTVRFEVAPDRVGQFVYEIAIPPQDGEATLDNNRRAFVVKVLRDKVRVLHVAGRPDWDVRALRTLLRRDPNVELLSYYILRGFDDIGREDTDALSLIQFPTEELFEEQLGSFDLVVLHNFDPLPHSVGPYLDDIARYVLDGGALVLIGGDLWLRDEGYRELEPVLPVVATRGGVLGRRPFRPALTEGGRRHPITAWLGAGTNSGWDELPELDTFDTLAMASHADDIGGVTLLIHPDARTAGGAAPLLAVAEPGKGRVMTLATGSTWRLGFSPELALVEGARPYDLLWLGAVRWLLRDDTSGRLVLETDKPRYRVGETVELAAKALSATYAPDPAVEIRWELRPLAEEADEEESSAENRPAPLAQGAWTTDDLGRARGTLEGLPVGAYAAIGRREIGRSDQSVAEGSTHEVRRVFLVEPPERELAQVDADPGTQRLRELAEATGGVFVDAVAGEALPADVAVGEPRGRDDALRVDARRELALWHGWLAIVLLVGAFGGEWLLRRRSGEG